MVMTFVPLAPTVSRDGPVVSFWVFGLGVGSEPLAAPGPAHAPTLLLPGRPHARSGTPPLRNQLGFSNPTTLRSFQPDA